VGKTFNTTADYLKKSNNLTGDTLYMGQVLSVPAKTYTVKSGDSLFTISVSNGISLATLRKANNKWNDVIYNGQKLLIPKSASSTSQVSNSAGQTASKAVIPYNASDVDLLARLINAEAGDQPYSAKVSVGAVIVNRVKDPRFPKTIKGVIYQVDGGYYQFTPVLNGWINKPATEECKKAAYDALNGVDPTHGGVYYFDDSTTNNWLWSKPIAARIGKMVYTY
jgi:spore germination cell wall hydrolase CwlJ-like protein